MKLSDDWQDFMRNLERVHPRIGDTIPMTLDDEYAADSGLGL